MRDSYNRGGGNRGGFGNRRDSYDKPEMFDAVCDECGRDCQVPFRPSGDKPIYCSRCFEKVDPRRDERRPAREDRFRRSDNYNSRDNFQKPRFNDREKPKSSNADISQLKDQLGSISAKLDKLLRLLTPVVVEEKSTNFEAKVKVKTIKELKDEIEVEGKNKKELVSDKVKPASKKKTVKKTSK